MLDPWKDVAQDLVCIIPSGTTNPPHFIDEDAETQRQGPPGQQMDYAAWQVEFTLHDNLDLLPKLGFLNVGTIENLGQTVLCKMFSCIPGLYVLDASSTPPQL